METAMLCLANSKKNGERCVAGVEVKIENERVEFLYDKDRPKWLRPVSETEHGEVSEDVSAHLQLLDVVAINILRPCPWKAQTENVYFKRERLKVVCSIDPNLERLDTLCTTVSPLFGNYEDRVAEDELVKIDYSLAFIRVEDFFYYFTHNKLGKECFYAKFTHQGSVYNFKITDLHFLHTSTQKIPQYKNLRAYLTLSLGEVFKGNSYKLIAGVIIL